MSQPATFWQKYGTLAQCVKTSIKNAAVIPPDCKLRKT
jgi:hypothetical protein